MAGWVLLISIVIIGVYLFEQWLKKLNIYRLSPYLPVGADGIYDEAKYAQSQNYTLSNYRFGRVQAITALTVSLAFLWFGLYGKLDNWLRVYTSNELLLTFAFFGSFMLISTAIFLPFTLWDTFVIEKNYGFNRTSVLTFIVDIFRGIFLASVMNGLIIGIIWAAYKFTGNWFWVTAWVGVSAFSIFMNAFYTTLIVPIFNKLTPIPDGELKTAIQGYCDKVGFPLTNIFVIDGSKRSTKANAYFSGLGARKDIVLYDTLINDYTTEQILAVLAHEVGHYKCKHILWGMTYELAYIGACFYLLSLILGNDLVSKAMGVTIPSFYINLLAFTILIQPLDLIYGAVSNFFSRWMEYQADDYAKNTYSGEHMVSGLKKIYADSLDNLTPHPFYVFMYYSHPTLLNRLKNLQRNS